MVTLSTVLINNGDTIYSNDNGDTIYSIDNGDTTYSNDNGDTTYTVLIMVILSTV